MAAPILLLSSKPYQFFTFNGKFGMFSTSNSLPPAPTPDILWWKMNDGSGTTITADVGTNGTTNAGWNTGKSGSGFSLDFNGIDAGANSNSTIAYGTGLITICAWVWFNALDSTRILWESTANYNNISGTLICYVNNGDVHFGIHNSSSNLTEYYEIYATTSLIATWMHIAIVYDNTVNSGDIKIYFDGVLQSFTVATNSKTTSGNFTDQTLFVGERNNATLSFDGRIDDLRIYSGGLDVTQIASIINEPA